jgi:hypothetical protein
MARAEGGQTGIHLRERSTAVCAAQHAVCLGGGVHDVRVVRVDHHVTGEHRQRLDPRSAAKRLLNSIKFGPPIPNTWKAAAGSHEATSRKETTTRRSNSSSGTANRPALDPKRSSRFGLRSGQRGGRTEPRASLPKGPPAPNLETAGALAQRSEQFRIQEELGWPSARRASARSPTVSAMIGLATSQMHRSLTISANIRRHNKANATRVPCARARRRQRRRPQAAAGRDADGLKRLIPAATCAWDRPSLRVRRGSMPPTGTRR